MKCLHELGLTSQGLNKYKSPNWYFISRSYSQGRPKLFYDKEFSEVEAKIGETILQETNKTISVVLLGWIDKNMAVIHGFGVQYKKTKNIITGKCSVDEEIWAVNATTKESSDNGSCKL